MNKNLGLVSLFASALLFSAACGDDDDNQVAVDATTNPAIDSSVVLIDSGVTIDGPIQPAVDAMPLPDAGATAFSCAGDPLPTTVANPPIVISGAIQEATFNGIVPLAESAHISAHSFVGDGIIAEGDFIGTFTITDPTASTTPLDAYIKATVSGYLDTYIFPGAPIAENIGNAPVIMLSNSLFGLLSLLTGIDSVQGTGTLITGIVDCNNASIAGAVVSISPNVGTIKYADATGQPGAADFPSTQASGVAYIFNVPPGEYTISATTGNGLDLRDNDVRAFANGLATIVVVP